MTTSLTAIASAPPPQPGLAGLSVLIVDDELIGRETVAALLMLEGYRLAYASNGAEALAQAAALRPDLILLDVMMPGMDGFEVCRRLRADPEIGEVPVLMLTALDDRDSRLQGIEAGADDFVSKPFDRAELRARVRTILRLNRYRRLVAERDKLARVIEFAPDGMLIVDQAGIILLANPAIVGMIGAPDQAALLGQPISTFLSVSQRDTSRASLDRVFATAAATRIESTLAGPFGARKPIEMQIGYLSWDDRPAAQIIARDITERKHAELLEGERRQIAYELHDGLAQMVISVHQHLQAFAARHRPRVPATRGELDNILDLARRSVTEIRRVIAGLRPTALDDFGLTAALRIHVAALQADGWEISYHETLGDTRLTPGIETVLYRVTQEALTNVRKHARTTHVAVRLERDQSTLRLEIQDWGCGFELARVLAETRLGERLGLRGMQERVALLGGHWQVHSHPGAGTLIRAEIPLPDEQKRNAS